MTLIIDWLEGCLKVPNYIDKLIVFYLPQSGCSKVPIYIDKLIVFHLNPQSGPPTFITPVRDATAPAGGAATFNVYVTGSPMPNVTW